jgi:hypothetical protein
MELVFTNCATFNKPGQDSFELGKILESAFKEIWDKNKAEIENSFRAEGPPKITKEEFNRVRINPEAFSDTQAEAAKRQRRSIESLINPRPVKAVKKEIQTLADEWDYVKQELLKSQKKYAPKPKERPVLMDIEKDSSHHRDEDRQRINDPWGSIVQLHAKPVFVKAAAPNTVKLRLAVGHGDKHVFLTENGAKWIALRMS